jgi:hypothetical protein
MHPAEPAAGQGQVAGGRREGEFVFGQTAHQTHARLRPEASLVLVLLLVLLRRQRHWQGTTSLAPHVHRATGALAPLRILGGNAQPGIKPPGPARAVLPWRSSGWWCW